MASVGILGLGSYLPSIIRKNDWWPASTVATWVNKQEIKHLTRQERENISKLTPGQQKVAAANESLAHDPFRGAVERRVMPDTMLASEMETEAAEVALKRSGIPRDQIDLLLVQSIAPDFLHVPNACKVHHNLGLAKQCHSMSVEQVCNSFLQQLALAEASIQAGRARYALLVQSAEFSRFADYNSQGSAWFGDGATAVVIGRVSDTLGLTGIANATYGDFHGVLVTGVPGKRWYDGRPSVYVPDGDRLRMQFMNIPDEAADVVGRALEQSKQTPGDVSFLACHQATPWLPGVVCEHLGLTNARHLNTFAQTTSMNGANLPFILETAEKEGVLRDGDVVAMFSGAAGVSVTGAVMRWGVG